MLITVSRKLPSAMPLIFLLLWKR